MKLYATIYSPESSRPSKKGSNDQLKVTLHFGNEPIGTLEFYTTNGKNYKLYYNDKFIEEGGEEKGETKKGECLNNECQNQRMNPNNYCEEHLRIMGFLR